jgi:hypothetical protein
MQPETTGTAVMTRDTPLFDPAASIVPEPQNGSSGTPSGDRTYPHHRSATA